MLYQRECELFIIKGRRLILNVPLSVIEKALHSDYYIIFGSSYIKSPLIDFLVDHNAINIHMGVSPYYRGNSCNFWAVYDDHPDLVGATIHKLSKGLDSGDMLYHALPKPEAIDPFDLGMRAVQVAQDSLVSRISSGEILQMEAVPQNKEKQLRYTKNKDFNDLVAKDYLEHKPTPEHILKKLKGRNLDLLQVPFIG